MRTHRYRITISGSLGETGREAFGDFGIQPDSADTVLTGGQHCADAAGSLSPGPRHSAGSSLK